MVPRPDGIAREGDSMRAGERDANCPDGVIIAVTVAFIGRDQRGAMIAKGCERLLKRRVLAAQTAARQWRKPWHW